MKIRLLILCWLLSTILATTFGVLVISPEYRTLDAILAVGIPVSIFGLVLYTAIVIKQSIDKKIKKIAKETLGGKHYEY